MATPEYPKLIDRLRGDYTITEGTESFPRQFYVPAISKEAADLIEAQALQTPVVSFRSGGVVEAVEEGTTALLSPEKDVAGLAKNIAQLLENSTLRHNMGTEGRKRVEENFDVRKQCAKLESIYARLT